MKTETTPVKVDTTHGPLYIAVMPADRHSYYDSERGDVTDLRPFLRIATDPAFEADPTHTDHWTIRGRAYAVHYEVFFEDRTGIECANGYQGERWHRSGYTPYRGGFRNDRRGPVEFGTATYTAMWAAVVDALDTFDASHPGWMELSRFLLLRAGAAGEADRAEEARQQAAKHDAEAVRLSRVAAEHSVKVPDRVMALYTAKEE